MPKPLLSKCKCTGVLKMKLVNLTNSLLLADKIEVAGNFRKRLKGLIGRRRLNQGEALILLPCNSIHTCFMNFPIDVLFVDKKAMVLQTLEDVKPFRFSSVVPKSYMVVELPAGCLAATGTRAGHRLQLKLRRRKYEA